MLRVIDNTGASMVRCFNVLRKRKAFGRIGDIIVGSVREVSASVDSPGASSATANRAPRVQKGQVVHGVIVRTKKETRREDGTYVRFDDNAIVLVELDPKKGIQPRGTRITGVVAQELRKHNMAKILSLAPHVV